MHCSSCSRSSGDVCGQQCVWLNLAPPMAVSCAATLSGGRWRVSGEAAWDYHGIFCWACWGGAIATHEPLHWAHNNLSAAVAGQQGSSLHCCWPVAYQGPASPACVLQHCSITSFHLRTEPVVSVSAYHAMLSSKASCTSRSARQWCPLRIVGVLASSAAAGGGSGYGHGGVAWGWPQHYLGSLRCRL